MDFITNNFSKEIAVFLLSMMPVSELRGSIPLGISLGISPWKSFTISLIGNIIIVPILLLIFRPVIRFFARTRFLKKPARYIIKKIDNRASRVTKYELFGLFLLVAIPLPTTGAWTGCGVASLLKLDYKKSLISIIAGVISSGLIVLLLSFIGLGIIK